MSGYSPTDMVVHTEYVLPSGELFHTRTRYSATRHDAHIAERLCTRRCYINAVTKGKGRVTVERVQPWQIVDRLWMELQTAPPKWHPEAAAIVERYGQEWQEWRDRGGYSIVMRKLRGEIG